MSEDVVPDWAAIADAYARGPLTVAQICTKFGISRTALYRQARQLGWPRRRKTLRERAGSAHAVVRTEKRRKSALGGRDQIIGRLYEALERKMTELETRIEEGRRSAAECERDARTLNTLVRLFERLSDMEDKSRSKTDAPTQASGETIDQDAVRLRKELARRLDRLRSEGRT